MINENSIISEICAMFNGIDERLCDVMPSECFTSCGEPSMWIVTKGGSLRDGYADGDEILKVPFELKLRHRDIDPSDRFSAVASLEKLVSAVRKTGAIEDAEYPTMPESADSGTALYSVSMKYVKKCASQSESSDRELRIIIKNGTYELRFARHSPLRILSDGLCGFDFPGVNVKFLQDAAGHGSYTESRMLCHRDMSIHFEVTDESQYKAVRDRVISMMDPANELTVTGYYMGRHRTVKAYPSGVPEFYPNDRRIKIYFSAAKPYFTEGKVVRADVPRVRPVLSFPLSMMKNAGTVCSFAEDRTKVKVMNPGDTSCPVTVYINAMGDVSRPYLILDGRKIKYLGDLHTGEMLRIRTGDEQRGITVNNIVSYDFDRSSRFFSLAPGENDIMIYADRGSENMTVYFEFEPRYLGI